MKIVPVSCLSDNYAYLLIDEGSGEAAVVDPSEADPVITALAGEGARLSAILCTHHHWDHVGGNEELLGRFPGVPVYAHESDRGRQRVSGQTVGLSDGQALHVCGADAIALH